MASSSKTIQPSQYGGHSTQDGGALVEKFFGSRCPPVVTPDTTIIAVCGPNDKEDNTSPVKDGWFFSDFYLFHHLFQNTAKRQYWLTCVGPQILVQKYKEFVRGDPRTNDRRVVLDNTFAKAVQDVLVFPPSDLLERFLSYVTEACKNTKDTQHPVLVLIFGHGEEEQFSICIGGEKTWLYRAKFKVAIQRHNPRPNVSVLTTSCFGGGWTQMAYFNITAMSGTDTNEETLLWPQSASISRACGSRYADGVAQALIRSEFQSLDRECESEIQQSTTYDALVETIRTILTKEIDVREINRISFSAQDVNWNMEWRARTGFTLSTYEAKWHALKLIPQGSASGVTLSASVRFSDFVYLSIPEAEFPLRRHAYDYLTSKPGGNSTAKNHYVHGLCHRILQNQTLNTRELEELAAALKYRLKKIISRATAYKDRLGLSYSDCREVDIEEVWRSIRDAPGILARYETIIGMVGQANLFDEPQEHEGHRYAKGNRYLALAFIQSDWTRSAIESALTELIKFKNETSPLVGTVKSFRFGEVQEVQGMIGTLSKSFKKRLRSQSPTKRKRQSLEGVFPGPGGFRERRSEEGSRWAKQHMSYRGGWAGERADDGMMMGWWWDDTRSFFFFLEFWVVNIDEFFLKKKERR